MSRLVVIAEPQGARLQSGPASYEAVFAETDSVLAHTSRGGFYTTYLPDWGRRAMEALHWLQWIVGGSEFLAVAEFRGDEVFLSKEDLQKIERADSRAEAVRILEEIRRR